MVVSLSVRALACISILTISTSTVLAGPDSTGDGTGGPRGGSPFKFVDCTGADGAFTTIQAAIDDADDGNVVFISPNECTPDGHWHERIDFHGKRITVQSMHPEDPAVVDATIIDGDGGGSVVRFVTEEGGYSILDGLTLVNGAAPEGDYGGGVFVFRSSPSIRRCVLRDNVAEKGGGIGVYVGRTILIDSCRFEGNASTDGGASGSGYYSNSTTTSILFNCTFEDHAGAVVSFQKGATPSATCNNGGACGIVQGCGFHDNPASYVFTGDGATLSGCDFVGNTGVCADGAYLRILDSLFQSNTSSSMLLDVTRDTQIEGSDFVDNHVSTRILGSSLFISDLQIRDCRFTENTGNMIALIPGFGLLQDCDFTGNVADRAVVEFRNSENSSVERCRFTGNTSNVEFGILSVLASSDVVTIVRDLQFVGNSTHGGFSDCLHAGGAVHVENCLAVGNRCDLSGAAISVGSNGVATGCTVVGNRSAQSFSGIRGGRVENCIVWNNRNGGFTSNYSQVQSGNVRYSLVNVLHGVGVFDLDPGFVNPGYWDDMGTPADESDDVFVVGDYRLRPDSPCIDTGDPAFVAGENDTDLGGGPRVQGCRVDMGVFEFSQTGNAIGDVNGDGLVDVDDLPAFVEKTLRPWGLGVCAADVNEDGFVDGRDVSAMTALLLGG